MMRSPQGITPQQTPIAWLRQNLFSSWLNSAITLLLVVIIVTVVGRLGLWITTEARWTVLVDNWTLFFVGRYPAAEQWRLWLWLGLLSPTLGLTWGCLATGSHRWQRRSLWGWAGLAAAIAGIPLPWFPHKLGLAAIAATVPAASWLAQRCRGQAWLRFLPTLWGVLFLVGLWLLQGGLGLRPVSSNDWSGLLLTLATALISMVCSLPLGILLALGRQSSLPAIRWLSVTYIELFRGLPLVTILFFGQVMVPLMLDSEWRIDRILRAIVGLTIFLSAYLAETVRGGLQAIPQGQFEAAAALGLDLFQTYRFIVLPQALRISIPAIVGLFLNLLQDTTLLSIVGLLELLGISRSILANPAYLGRYAEVYLFLGVLYWLCCYGLAQLSRRLEQRLTPQR
ncbi:permease protein of amino acid ABC transporter [Synechococcus elongatus PCC 6301]|uniref:Permease protein of amino acid ABC transporter n=1 Tax=Synechococcus sp. (strain ATCC 27144 / PCC 6301 / SAUG 1402/1) TaxID=269084 RepID=A0A0H3K2I5_SYNP6|nr:amino acid ABC transporter permease [Synechococcus elongatus]BAD79455.1 permease protein of amino acid ABC transporter [Synechococcus elongatus PCC 6301]